MSGSGTTVVLAGATGALHASGKMHVSGSRQLVNEGTTTLSSGHLPIATEAVLMNVGTFKVNSGSSPAIGYEGGIAPTIQNTGTFERTEGTGVATIEPKIENRGVVYAQSGSFDFTEGGSSSATNEWHAVEGQTIEFAPTAFTLVGGVFVGSFTLGAHVSIENADAKAATLTLASVSELSVGGGSPTVVGTLDMTGGRLLGTGSLEISSSLSWSAESNMEGSGMTLLRSGASGTLTASGAMRDTAERMFINEGTITLSSGHLGVDEHATFKNVGLFKTTTEAEVTIGRTGESSVFINSGTLEKTGGAAKARIEPKFENLGAIKELSGKYEIEKPVSLREKRAEYGGGESPSTVGQTHACEGDPVTCATGNFTESETDFAIGGRGVGLVLTRTYNSQAAAEGIKGAFGYGWSASFSDHLVVEKEAKQATLVQADGSTVAFTESGSTFVAPAWTQDTLTGSAEAGYTLTVPSQVKYKFAASTGRLESVTDRDGNATSLTYNEAGELTAITDPVGRKLKLAYNAEGLVASAEDPMGHLVKYTYEGGNLKSVTQPAEASLRWQFKYDGSHEITELTDGRGDTMTNEYNFSHQVVLQKDAAEHKLKFEYEAFHTTITNENTGAVTSESFTSNDEPSSITRGYGTALATTTSFTYNEGGYLTGVTDGNGHTTAYAYNSSNDRTSMVDADKDETKWTYDSTHDIETMTTPKGETTTIKRESHGNPEVIERPAPASKTQTTKYKYTAHGELESATNPLEHTWTYEYDSKGDRTAETDPEGNKRTWEYNEDSQETASISPRGNAEGAEASKFTTKTEVNAQGRPVKITDPLGHATEYKYDGDGNVEKVTDGNKHTTTYSYNGDNESTKIEAPNKAAVETEYDAAGQVIVQIDGDKHKTKYKRNVLEEVTEVTDPLGYVTTKEYDPAGNLVKLVDPSKRATTYTYDPADRLTEVSYSSGKPAADKYEYDKDGNRIKMTDATGTTTNTYDQLDRLTESEDGHKEVVKYEYDLANEQTKITYPSGKAVTRAFDKDGRMAKVTDWLEHSTEVSYDADSDLATTVFPSETKDEDKYAYNDADEMTEVKMVKSSETLASLVYTRDSDGQVKLTTAKKLPGTEATEATYDENSRLTKYGAVEYQYDAANNPTTEGASTNTFNENDELEKGTGESYSYDELGERTKTTPEKGPATAYGYDQAGDLTSAERPKEGETEKIEDSYAYNGEGLRTSQTISGTTSYLTWDTAEELPLIVSDGTNSYVYGPHGLPVEQINNSTGTVTYLHHDQAGSTRLLTGSTGTVTGKCTYSAYGTPTCEGTSTTPRGYDSQYTSTDTGLIYLRNRVYDPTTAQFLTVDPLEKLTGAPYNYAGDNPVNESDPTGLSGIFGTGIGPNVGPDINWSEEGFWSTVEHVTLGVAGVGDTLATGITTVIATPICFAGVSAAPVIGQIAGYPACATFAAGGAAFTAYEAYETYWEWEQAFKGSGPAISPKETADTCQPAERPPLVSGF